MSGLSEVLCLSAKDGGEGGQLRTVTCVYESLSHFETIVV